MASDKDKTESTVSTEKGTETNEVIQKPEDFFDPQRELDERNVDPPKNHATKGMTELGYTEASRVRDER